MCLALLQQLCLAVCLIILLEMLGCMPCYPVCLAVCFALLLCLAVYMCLTVLLETLGCEPSSSVCLAACLALLLDLTVCLALILFGIRSCAFHWTRLAVCLAPLFTWLPYTFAEMLLLCASIATDVMFGCVPYILSSYTTDFPHDRASAHRQQA